MGVGKCMEDYVICCIWNTLDVVLFSSAGWSWKFYNGGPLVWWANKVSASFADFALLNNFALLLFHLLSNLLFSNYCRKMQERLRDPSGDENTQAIFIFQLCVIFCPIFWLITYLTCFSVTYFLCHRYLFVIEEDIKRPCFQVNFLYLCNQKVCMVILCFLCISQYKMNLILVHYQCKKILHRYPIQSCIAISVKVFDSIIHYLKSFTKKNMWLDDSVKLFALTMYQN